MYHEMYNMMREWFSLPSFVIILVVCLSVIILDVTYENWKEVPAAQKDLIWEDIQVCLFSSLIFLVAKIYNLLTIKPNLLFVRRNLKSLKLLIVGQRRKFFRRWVIGGGNLNPIWPGNGHLHPTRTVWMTLSMKNMALARRNRPCFVRPAEIPQERYVLCNLNCFPLKI